MIAFQSLSCIKPVLFKITGKNEFLQWFENNRNVERFMLKQAGSGVPPGLFSSLSDSCLLEATNKTVTTA